jgi:hypothetical protein
MLPYGDRLVLINIVFTSMPIFILSFLEISNGVRKSCIFIGLHSFWDNDVKKKKYLLTKWTLFVDLSTRVDLS